SFKNYEMKKELYNHDYDNKELNKKTIGVIEVGRVDSQVTKYAKTFNMNIIGYDINDKLKLKYKWIKFTSLKNLLKLSDIITLHVTLNLIIENMILVKHFKLMKK